MAEIAQNDSLPDACKAALERFIKQGTLKTANEQETSSEIIPEPVRKLREALKKVTDQTELIGHAYAPDTETRREVIKK